MTEGKTKVTLIGSVYARQGLEFIYEGDVPACETCKVKKACHNLVKGRKYRVMTIRTTRHDCPVHFDGAFAVEVAEAPSSALISAEMAIVNSKIRFEVSCNKSDCKSYDLCHPDGIVEGEKYIVADVLGNAPDICEKGRTLKLVELKNV